MRPLKFSLNITLDGCYDHRVGLVDEEMHNYHAQNIANVDALILGRVTYQMMEDAWKQPGRSGVKPDWMEDWMMPFAQTIDAAKKYVVSNTLESVDWNAEIIRGDFADRISQLKQESGKGLGVGGVQLAFALTELGLIDEYVFVVNPRIVGHGPTLFAGLSKYVDLKLVNKIEFGSGAMALSYERKM